MKRWYFWNSLFEEMLRAKHCGYTYRFRDGMVARCPIARSRASRIARYAYARMEKAS